MAFVLSKGRPATSFSEMSQYDEKANPPLNQSEENETEKVSPVSSHLYLKSSSVQSSPEALHKEVVLRRIRHHKCLSKVRSAFHALSGSSGVQLPSDYDNKWLELGDSFTCP